MAVFPRNMIGIRDRKVPQAIEDMSGITYTPVALSGFETVLAKANPISIRRDAERAGLSRHSGTALHRHLGHGLPQPLLGACRWSETEVPFPPGQDGPQRRNIQRNIPRNIQEECPDIQDLDAGVSGIGVFL